MFECVVCGDMCDDWTVCYGCEDHVGTACGECCPALHEHYMKNKERMDSWGYTHKLVWFPASDYE